MQLINVAFDVDGCLIDWNEQSTPVVELVKFFGKQTKNCRVLIWSRRGEDWAKKWVEELGLEEYVWHTAEKSDEWIIDIAFDDMHAFAKADKNVIVKLTK